ncbi:GCN5-related N-acetyltransferase [Haloterrigena turkmenica DSM 5511]|uniref:GCN5-related N-acetyltransferase n=1 Tax=Haloterrigena turkmenica (strain ATCC 51198 / DSM 5511 / JCM 9101 / NCIMB 13204 / VKM B-1734 / 4k) TaxID=543526 RepID=D2RVS8_HALTV|nr:GNAT family N-acetyltransferase [Haloterrigena turkmenica]ADB59442.1 GCN5-related N-acetyltransferase [Haloterrigena turkmenica DSM 5511]
MTEVRVADAERAREDAFAVRQTVFVEEQGVDEELEYDAHDETATHFVAYDGDEPVGAARLREYEDGVGKVERVAVLESHREDGVGRAVMDAVEVRAREEGLESLKLHSQTRAAGFYRSLGYERHGEEFEEAGIPHVKMRKLLGESE